MIRTVHGSSKQLLNVLPAIGVGLLGALLVIPLLPPEASDMLLEATLWQQAENIQGTIVGATAVVCLLVLWLQRPSSGGSKHGKKHKS